MMRGLSAFVAFLVATASVSGQPKTVFAPPKKGTIENTSLVAAHQSRWAAVSDVHNLLVFCHDRVYPDAHVSLVKLVDAKGLPAPYATQLKLPRPEGLAKIPNYALSAALHPKLPLLYVWQDISVHYSNPPGKEPPDLKSFDHLVIYNLAKEPPEVLAAFCRGTEFIYGQAAGGLAIDAGGSYLYVPNLRELTNAGSLRLGRFPLDADGLPLLSDKDAKEPVPVRGKRLMDANAVKPLSPPDLTPVEYVNLFPMSGYGAGTCFHPVGKDVVIAGGHGGLMSWRPDDKISTLSSLPFRHSGHVLIGAHPSLPALFATCHRHDQPDSFFRAEQVEGYLSLLPRQYVIPGAQLTSPPMVVAKGKKLVVGGHHFLYQFKLDDKGMPLPDVTQMQVYNPMVRAMAYSEKFDRLYVGTDVSK